jgi:hypothetical protein
MTAPQSPEQTAQPGTAARCLNCGAPLTGRYCANCGQTADVHVPSTRELFHEAIEGITHSDSRLWNSLKLLWFKPGKLTQEFVAGRRAAYLPPFRLYLVLSIIFFLAASFYHSDVNLAVLDKNGKVQVLTTSDANCDTTQFELFVSHALAQRLRHGCKAVVRDHGASLVHVAVGAMPKALFILLPVIAFLHMLMYRRPRYRYAEHLLFFLHVQAFFFSAMTLVVLLANAADAWPRAEGAAQILSLALLGSLPLYTVVAMKRVFNAGWLRTLLKGFALFIGYAVVLEVTVVGVFTYAAMQL